MKMNTDERIVVSFTLKEEERHGGEVLRGHLDDVSQGGCVASGPSGMGEAEAVDGARRFVLRALAARWGALHLHPKSKGAAAVKEGT